MTKHWLKNLAEKFDIVLVGDGSGVNEEGAWAVVLMDNRDHELRLFLGGASKTTVNVMELEGYLHALNYLWRKHSRDGATVLILSDSSYVVNCGNGESTPRSNLEFWAAMQRLKRQFFITFMFLERCSFPLNSLCDSVAGGVRKEIRSILYLANEKLGDWVWETGLDPVSSEYDLTF